MKTTPPASSHARPNADQSAQRPSEQGDRRLGQRTKGDSHQRSSFSALLAQVTQGWSENKLLATASKQPSLEGALGAARELGEQRHDLDLSGPPIAETPAWIELQQARTDIGASLSVSASAKAGAPDIPEANFGAMFEQFVSAVRVGKQGDLACVSLTLDLGGATPVQVMIEETSMGPMIDVKSDNPADAMALERALAKH